jgi:hypothetical protein
LEGEEGFGICKQGRAERIDKDEWALFRVTRCFFVVDGNWKGQEDH